MKPSTDVILHNAAADTPSNPFVTGEVLREAIFYESLSAYAFQYRDMAIKRYVADADWLSTNKSIRVDVFHAVCRTVVEMLQERVVETLDDAELKPPVDASMLVGFTFSCSEVAVRAHLSRTDVLAVVEAFSLPDGERNTVFTSLRHINPAYVYPLIRRSTDEFILLQNFSIAEAFYNTPFYWMLADEAYSPVVHRNRGNFTEAFAYQRFTRVFGPSHFFCNVEIQKSKQETIDEVAVLVVYGDQAIELQAKSKMLTLKARSGNETELRKDFRAAVPDAADQALSCASAVLRTDVKLQPRNGSPIPPLSGVREILPISVISDHYPALAF